MTSATAAPKTLEGWRKNMTAVTVLYRMVECGEEIPMVGLDSSRAFLEPILDDLNRDGLLEADASGWKVTDKGRGVLKKAQEMMDHVLQFEIFGQVWFIPLNEDEQDVEDPYQVGEAIDDPRFNPDADAPLKDERYRDENGNALVPEDLRIAMMTFLGEYLQKEGQLENGAVDPYQVVFLQKLGSGKLKGDKDMFWADMQLGTFFDEVEEIVRSAYQWRDIAEGDEENATAFMLTLRTAGITQEMKEKGSTCGECGSRLGVAEAMTEKRGEELNACPFCEASYEPPPPPEGQAGMYECPNCGADMTGNESACPNCGAEVDWGLAEGQVATTTEEIVEETVEDVYDDPWGYDYGYAYYGYYDPWDPYYDALAFGCLTAALLW